MHDSGFGYDETNDTLNRMRAGVAFRFPVRLRNFEILLRPLSMQETIETHAFVAEEMARAPANARTKTFEHSLLAKETLVRSSTSKPGMTDYRLTHLEMRDWLPDEIHALYKEYVTITEKVDPNLESLTTQQIEALVDGLKKSPPEELSSILTELSFSQLRDVTCSLIRSASQEDKSSGG